MGYWAYAFTLAVAFYTAVSWFGKRHLSQDAKDTLTLWLWGEYEGTWSQQFCNLFDAVFGAKHLSWTCFIRSALASVISVCLLYVLFAEVLGVLDPSRRTGGELPITQALLLGAAINIIPDYLSLYETRWLLKRFERVHSILGQLGVLVADAVVTGTIIWFAINVFQWSTGGPSLAAVEMLALFSVYSLFFYSTFLTSVWAWLFALSTWFMRLFSSTPLKHVLDVEVNPAAQIALVGALLIFATSLALTPIIKADEQQQITVLDELLCDFFPADICEHLGRLTEDDKRALSYLANACEGGVIDLCMDTARKYFEGDETKAVDLWRRACDGGHLGGCSNLGVMHGKGHGGLQEDETKEAALYQRSCDGGHLGGCSNLGAMHADGLGGLPKDETKAVALYQRSCDGGDAPGCSNLGVMYADGRGGLPKDETKAVALWRKACGNGDTLGCNNLGVMYAGGRGGLPKDETKAVAPWRKACDSGGLSSCSNLGLLHENGRGGLPKDGTKAVALYHRACDGGDLGGCNSLGVMHGKGHGGLPKDETKEAALYQRSCDGGHLGGCSNLGAMHGDGLGGLPKDETKAVALYQRACDGGDAPGCSNLGAMYAAGRGGLPKDETKAIALYQRACDGGDALGCANLSR